LAEEIWGEVGCDRKFNISIFQQFGNAGDLKSKGRPNFTPLRNFHVLIAIQQKLLEGSLVGGGQTSAPRRSGDNMSPLLHG
jgi:hypothetical protein